MEKQVDILIVGAGISGIGVAAHLSKHSPQRSFEIIERRESFGLLLGLILNHGKKPMY